MICLEPQIMVCLDSVSSGGVDSEEEREIKGVAGSNSKSEKLSTHMSQSLNNKKPHMDSSALT